MLHYELTGEERRASSGEILHRIRSTRAFHAGGTEIAEGETGGWITSLRQSDGTPRLLDDGWVAGEARVCEDAFVADSAFVGGHAWLTGQSQVSGSARVGGRARLTDFAHVTDQATVAGSSRLDWAATITGRARVSGGAWFVDWSGVGGSAWVTKDALVQEMSDCLWIDGSLTGHPQATFFLTRNGPPGLTIGRSWVGSLLDLQTAHAGGGELPSREQRLRSLLGPDWTRSRDALVRRGESWFAGRRERHGGT